MMAGKGVPSGTYLQELSQWWSRLLDRRRPAPVFPRSERRRADSPARLAGNTLLWEQDGLTLRIESGLQRDAAMRIAEQVRGTD